MKHKITQRIMALLHGQKAVNPRKIVGPYRIDIAAKTVFGKAYLSRNTSVWPEELYKEHLRAWNAFYESAPRKNRYKEFRDSYTAILDAMARKKFRFARSPAILDPLREVDNGAHRVSAAIATNNLINVKRDPEATAGHWDYEYFRHWAKSANDEGLAEIYLDAMTVEFATLFPDRIHVIILFPAAKGHRDGAEETIKSWGQIINKIDIPRNQLDGEAVVRQLYAGEWWNTDENSDHVKKKADACFAGKENMRIYLIKRRISEEELVQGKRTLREVWAIENHSIHISDTQEEAQRLVRTFFNANSRAVLAVEHKVEFPKKFGDMIRRYQEFLPQSFEERDKLCIDSSGTLAVLGIRDAQDIDILHIGAFPFEDPEQQITSHNEHAHWYEDSIDEILTNPRKHFYYNGMKFASLEEVRNMKLHRGEAKDKKDVKLIDEFVKKYPLFATWHNQG